jgi:hypothetical protein
VILSAIQRDDPALIGTLVQREGKYQNVWMTEEELFRAVLGNKEFERRVAAAFGTPPVYEEVKFEPMDIKRYIQLSEKKKKEGGHGA